MIRYDDSVVCVCGASYYIRIIPATYSCENCKTIFDSRTFEFVSPNGMRCKSVKVTRVEHIFDHNKIPAAFEEWKKQYIIDWMENKFGTPQQEGNAGDSKSSE